jgi:hypothetical protein
VAIDKACNLLPRFLFSKGVWEYFFFKEEIGSKHQTMLNMNKTPGVRKLGGVFSRLPHHHPRAAVDARSRKNLIKTFPGAWNEATS